MVGTPSFETNVFINCPFDKEYQPLLWALLFAVIDCGFEPRIALENADAGAVRIEKIKDLIQTAQYSIHDLSRMEALRARFFPWKARSFPRFNMPFELGLDLGCRNFGAAEHKKKKCLILEKEEYRYRQVLSDIAGNDIKAHNDEPETLVSCVRDWFHGQRSQPRAPMPSGFMVWDRYNKARSYIELTAQDRGYQPDNFTAMPVTEFIDFIKEWQEDNPVPPMRTH